MSNALQDPVQLSRSSSPEAGFGTILSAAGNQGGARFAIGDVEYNSRAGNGPFGFGISGHTPMAISRRTHNGVPTYDNGIDEFLLGGMVLVPELDDKDAPRRTEHVIKGRGERLGNVLVHFMQLTTDQHMQSHTVHYYRTREESFLRIEHWVPTRDSFYSPHLFDFWRILTGDGSMQFFGVRASSRVSDPQTPNRVFQWLQDEHYGARGDTTLFQYVSEDQIGTGLTRDFSAQKYLTSVWRETDAPHPRPISLYPEESLDNLFTEIPFQRETVLDYGHYQLPPENQTPYRQQGAWPARQDPFSDYTAGFEIRTNRLCRRTLEFSHLPEASIDGAPALLQAVCYGYTESPVVTRLKHAEILSFHYDDSEARYRLQGMPAEEINYSQFEPEAQNWGRLQRADGGPLVIGAGFMPMDLLGEGVTGFLHDDGDLPLYYRAAPAQLAGSLSNAQDGSAPDLLFQRIGLSRRLPSAGLNSQIGTYYADITGNGNLDLVVVNANESGFFEYDRRAERWGGFTPFSRFPSEAFGAAVFEDITGDGRSDFVVFLTDQIRYYPNLGNGRFGNAQVLSGELPAGVFQSQADQLRDFASIGGSGLRQLVEISQSRIRYWPNLGHGRFAAPVTLENAPDFGPDFDISRLTLADLSGDGFDDLVYAGTEGIRIYLNRSGNGFETAMTIAWPEGFLYDDDARLYVSDVRGTGTRCLVLSSDTNGGQSFYFDPAGGLPPHLAIGLSNNKGAHVQLTYRTAASYYFEDLAQERPWLSRIAFPLQLVETVSLTDEIAKSHLVSQNRYRHACFDPSEREFCGFAILERTDTPSEDTSFDRPRSTHSRAWFNVGADNHDVLSAAVEMERFDGDAKAVPLRPAETVYVDGSALEIAPADETDASRQTRLAALHQARNSLKGKLVRRELYGLDGTVSQTIPYQVSEHRHFVQLTAPKAQNAYALTYTRALESLEMTYERYVSDPRVIHQFNLAHDGYGNVTKQASIIYPRRAFSIPPAPGQDIAYKAQYEPRLEFEARAIENFDDQNQPGFLGSVEHVYLTGIVLSEQSFVFDQTSLDGMLHLRNLLDIDTSDYQGELVTVEALDQLLAGYLPASHSTEDEQGYLFETALQQVAICSGWTRNHYIFPNTRLTESALTRAEQDPANQPIGEAFHALDLGRKTRCAYLLPWYTLSVAYDKQSVADELGEVFVAYWSEDIGQSLRDEARYIDFPGAGAHWWRRSGFEIYESGETFHSIARSVDGTGAEHAYEHGPHRLYAARTTDPMGNSQSVSEFDFRHLKPTKTIDENANQNVIVFDAMGRPLSSSMSGTQTRVERSEASTTGLVLGSSYVTGFGSVSDQMLRLTGNDPVQTPAMPETVLQNADAFLYPAMAMTLYYDFAWCGRVTRTDCLALSTPDAGIELYNALIALGIISEGGCVLSRAQNLLESDASIGLTAYNPALRAFEAETVAHLQTLLAHRAPQSTLSLQATSYPRLFAEDLIGLQSDSAAPLTRAQAADLIAELTAETDGLIDENGLLTPYAMELSTESQINLSAVFSAYRSALFERLSQRLQADVELTYLSGTGLTLQSKTKASPGRDCVLYTPDADAEDRVVYNTDNTEIPNRYWCSGHIALAQDSTTLEASEPYFVDDWHYIERDAVFAATAPEIEPLKRTSKMLYDALNREIAQINSQGFLTWIERSAWMTVSYEANCAYAASPHFHANFIANDAGSEYHDARLSSTDREVLTTWSGLDLTPVAKSLEQSLAQSGTPRLEILDNRARVIAKLDTDTYRLSAEDFADMTEAPSVLFEHLQDKQILDPQGYVTRGVLNPILGLGSHALDPPQSSLAGASRTIQAFLMKQLQNTVSFDMTELAAHVFARHGTYANPSALWSQAHLEGLKTRLLENGYILETEAGRFEVSSQKIALPAFEPLDTPFAEISDQVLARLIELWGSHREELPSVTYRDAQAREIATADARFVQNSRDIHHAALFA